MLKNRFHKRRSGAKGLAALSALVLAAACGQSKDPAKGGGGSGGSSGSTYSPPGSDPIPRRQGGTPMRSGGVAGSDPVAGGGTGGMPTPPIQFDCVGEVPNQPVITSFDAFMQGLWSSPGNLNGRVYVYPELLKLQPDDALHFEAQIADHSGVGVWFAQCIDASKFRGVRFSISGDVGPSSSVQVYAVSNRDLDVDEENRLGACHPSDPENPSLDCQPPGVALPVTSEPMVRSIPWAAFKGGLPTATTDGSDILALQWSFTWDASMSPYPVKLVVDDLRFFTDDEPLGGAGPSGGGGEGGAP